jgi:hypothetical protein
LKKVTDSNANRGYDIFELDPAPTLLMHPLDRRQRDLLQNVRSTLRLIEQPIHRLLVDGNDAVQWLGRQGKRTVSSSQGFLQAAGALLISRLCQVLIDQVLDRQPLLGPLSLEGGGRTLSKSTQLTQCRP